MLSNSRKSISYIKFDNILYNIFQQIFKSLSGLIWHTGCFGVCGSSRKCHSFGRGKKFSLGNTTKQPEGIIEKYLVPKQFMNMIILKEDQIKSNLLSSVVCSSVQSKLEVVALSLAKGFFLKQSLPTNQTNSQKTIYIPHF